MPPKSPHPSLLPTPSSSIDIKAQSPVPTLPLQLAFELPPPALTEEQAHKTLAYPMQAAKAVKLRRKTSTIRDAAGKDSFSLPPPPTRTRKIIQMKPQEQEEKEKKKEKEKEKEEKGKGTKIGGSRGGTGAGEDGGGRKKGAMSTAGRKQARKTAHSLIERRRRSKMNEEFAHLKSLIPACEGEMHKLAILQASIEYVKYLRTCIETLQSQNASQSSPAPPPAAFNPTRHSDDLFDDTDMPDSVTCSPNLLPPPHQSSVSPVLLPQVDEYGRLVSWSKVGEGAATMEYRGYAVARGYRSVTASPAFGPQQQKMRSASISGGQDLDQEAMAALLMLNSDRRGMVERGQVESEEVGTSGSARGMSVQDLLSS